VSDPADAPEKAPLPYRGALRLTRDAAARLTPTTVPLEEAVGRVTAREVISPEASPNADLAAMDGFAVCAADLCGATAGSPRRLDVIGSVAAGAPGMTGAHGYAASSGAVRIATGALLPVGFDTVLPFEEVAETPGRIEVTAPPAAGGNVRRTGEDHRPGDVALEAGRRIGPPHVLLLANLGCAEVEVVRRPRVAVLATGSEVVEDLSAPLRPGQVRNSNARYLMSALAASGCKPRSAGTVPDREDAVRTALQQMLEGDPPVDLILTIGGVSRGAADFVPAALAALGADYLFRGVALRPGKPVLCARLPGRGTLLFGLPGNPLAVLATFGALVVPCLHALQGLPPEPPAAAVLGARVHGRPSLTRFVLAHAVHSPAGGPERVVPTAGQKASQVGALRTADRWLVVPPERAELPPGASVITLPL
jgi:molybdopterin molybdotransferase